MITHTTKEDIQHYILESKDNPMQEISKRFDVPD